MSGEKERIEIFDKTMDMCLTNSELRECVSHSIKKQCVYWEGEDFDTDIEGTMKPARVVLSHKRTIQAASSEEYRGHRRGVLNFASSINPGGGVLRGTTTQEEGICRISTLYPALATQMCEGGFYQRHREWIKKGEMGRENRDDCIYTPDVMVFRNDSHDCEILPENEWFKVDVITCAAPDQRWNKDGTRFSPSPEELDRILTKRIDRIFKVAIKHGIEVLILGAFGCGAFGNSPTVVAKVFEKVLRKYVSYFRVIEFAVYSTSMEDKNYKAFSTIEGIEEIDYILTDKVFSVPEKYRMIDGSAIERTLNVIVSNTCICAGDGTGAWISDDTLKRNMAEKARKFGGGVRGLIAYKRYKYALKYISPMTEDIRYRYVATAMIMIGNALKICHEENRIFSYRKEHIVEIYRKTLSAVLLNKYPWGNDYFLDNGLNWQKLVREIHELYQETGAIELLTILRVLKALEWDEKKIFFLETQMENNIF